jgi:ceramide glucosyltransferase
MMVVRFLAALLMLERSWKHWMVVRFFRRPPPLAAQPVALVSILQPILSGDPTLAAGLEHNLGFRSSHRREYLWLLDDDDAEGQAICRSLAARYPEQEVRLITLPAPAERENPKMIKLIAGMQAARGDVLCVLDDDTRLPDDGLERCVPWLDQPGVGLAFGLPFYVNFSTIWSGLLSVFVNSHSLMTYIPYTAIAEPFTINGMLYVVRRAVFDQVGGFEGLQATLADDFAVAWRLRAHGYRLAQTSLCHGISTTVIDARQYMSVMRRWLVFPRESLMRHLGLRDRIVLYGIGMLPALLPAAVVATALLRPSRRALGYAAVPLVYNLALFAHLNQAYLQHSTPWRWVWLAPAVEVVFPFELLLALLAPQRINWRGHIMDVERGGTFRFVRRR